MEWSRVSADFLYFVRQAANVAAARTNVTGDHARRYPTRAGGRPGGAPDGAPLHESRVRALQAVEGAAEARVIVVAGGGRLRAGGLRDERGRDERGGGDQAARATRGTRGAGTSRPPPGTWPSH